MYGLDVLRALAILFVVYGHGVYQLAALFPGLPVNLPIFDGVSIFFVLSGYLIGGILLRRFERGGSAPVLLGGFWLRRWFRTLPNYFLILLVLLAWHSASGEPPDDSWRYFLFLQNFAAPHPPFFAEAWSLSVEEWFYILLPLALLVLVKLGLAPRQAALLLCLLVLVASPLWRYYSYLDLSAARDGKPLNLFLWDATFRKQVIMRLDSLIYGVLGAYLHRYHRGGWQRWRRPSLLLGLVLILLHRVAGYYLPGAVQAHGLFYSVFLFVPIALGTLLVLPWLSQLKQGRGLCYRLITRISLISYSMYLVHLSLVQYLLVPATLDLLPFVQGDARLWLHCGLYWGYTLALSVLLYKYFELPAMGLRERFSWGAANSQAGDRRPAATGQVYR